MFSFDSLYECFINECLYVDNYDFLIPNKKLIIHFCGSFFSNKKSNGIDCK